MKHLSSHLSGLIVLLLINGLNAQNKENSPLSRYGLGDPRTMSTGWMSGMANAGVGYISEQFYNPLNPASFSFLRQTDVELGITAKYNSLEDGKKKTSRGWSGGLNHIFVAIPLRNSINELLDRKNYKQSFALQFGLTPYSSVGYNSELRDTAILRGGKDTTTVLRSLQGDGLVNAFQLGFSYRYKDLAIGLQMNYLFGNLNYYQNLLYSNIPSTYDSYLTDKYHISGWKPTLGFIYRKILNQKEINKDNTQRKKLFSAGLTINLPTNFTSTHSALHVTRFDESIDIVDTVLYLNEQKDKGQLPFGIKAGVYYSHKDRYGLMTSFNYDDWDHADLPNGIIGVVQSTTQFQIGAWYKPGLSGFDKFFKKSIYRFGAYVGNDYRVVEGEHANNLGVTFGWGYPILFLRQDAMIHLNFDFGQRNLGNQLKDTYFMIHFGISINDNEWFLKRRYN